MFVFLIFPNKFNEILFFVGLSTEEYEWFGFKSTVGKLPVRRYEYFVLDWS